MRPLCNILFCVAVGFGLTATAADDLAAPAEEARVLTARFMKTLKGALITAMADQGPAGAIEVCRERAPALATELSRSSGWTVRRTSLRWRNPANRPDAWEQTGLEEFVRRQADGADPATLERIEQTTVNGRPAIRYLKAIPTGPECLRCHGQAPPIAVQQALARWYPEDRATGFSRGDIRGAFSLLKYPDPAKAP